MARVAGRRPYPASRSLGAQTVGLSNAGADLVGGAELARAAAGLQNADHGKHAVALSGTLKFWTTAISGIVTVAATW